MMQTTLVLVGLSCLLLLGGALGDDPDMKNGPSGWQTFKGNRGAKTIEFSHKKVGGKKPADEKGNGGVSGNSANLNARGQALNANAEGKTATGTRNGEKATAKDNTGNNNFVAEGRGRKATADVQGNKLTSARADNKEIAGEYNNAGKSVNANNVLGSETWNANLKGRLGTATDNKSGKKATLQNIAKNSRKVKGNAAGRSIVAGRSKTNSNSKYGYARVPKKFGGQTQYLAQQKAKGRTEYHTRVLQGKKNTIYQSSVNNRNEVGLHDKRGKKFATVKALDYTDVPCQRLKNNMFAKDTGDFKFFDKTMRIEYPQQNGVYQFPSCMDVSVDVQLPPGTRVKDLAAALTVTIPGCGEFYCGQGTQCLSHNCFYKSLCPDDNAKPSQAHKDPANFLLGQTTHDACNDNFPSGGRVTLKFHYCPDVEATMAKDKKCRPTAFSAISIASMQVQVDVWTVKQRPMGCNVNNPKDTDNVRKLGCKRVLINYSLKWKGIPDIGGIGTKAAGIVDQSNCALGKRPCIGHDKLDIFGGIFGQNKGNGLFSG